MKIELTKEQIEQFKEDRFVSCEWGKNRFYVEVDNEGNFIYAEVSSKFDEKEDMKRKSLWLDHTMLQKMHARKPYDSSYYHDQPLCPNCQTYMIYKFEYCPKCGQKLDWSERE